jgi:phosphoenolpyruvate carboxykinase (ATP)
MASPKSKPTKEPLPDEAVPAPPFDLTQYGITVEDIRRNLSPAVLYTAAIREDAKCDIADTGALIAFSGEKTGRSPKDKRVVEHPNSKDVWWGAVNVPIDNETFEVNRERAIDYLNTRQRLYVVDAFAGWDETHRAKIRVICTRPYHALFMHNMLIRPTREELADFGTPHVVIYNAGEFPANRRTKG